MSPVSLLPNRYLKLKRILYELMKNTSQIRRSIPKAGADFGHLMGESIVQPRIVEDDLERRIDL